MTKQEEIQQMTEHWLSVFAGLVRSGQLYSVDVQARLLLKKLNSKGVVIELGYDGKWVDSYDAPVLQPLIEVKDG